MALRASLKTKSSDPIEQAPLAVDQRKQAEQRYRLQVDRQTKKSFDNLEAAAEAGTVIKKAHPIVQVSIYDAVDCVNQLAPEHLHIATRDAEALCDRIDHAGAIFLGHYSPVAVGDYAAGPSHVLPTGGTARFTSGLSVNDFLHRSSVISFTRELK